MTIQQMKDAIRKVYDTASWKRKVDNMYDDQVVAIYYNFSERGILDKVLRKERPVVADKIEPPKNEQKVKYQQLTLFDFINQ